MHDPGFVRGGALPEARSYDGSGNNLAVPYAGAANDVLVRARYAPAYEDGVGAPLPGASPVVIAAAMAWPSMLSATQTSRCAPPQ